MKSTVDAIATVFNSAQQQAPAVIVIEHMDVVNTSRDYICSHARQTESGPSLCFFHITSRENLSHDSTSFFLHVAKILELRAAATLISCLDAVQVGRNAVAVLGTAVDPDRVGASLRRAGRFGYTLTMRPPDESSRRELMKVLLSQLTKGAKFDVDDIAKKVAAASAGCSPADLSNICREAVLQSCKRGDAVVDWNDFVASLQCTRPSVLSSVQV
eukprot:SAG31_NODE_547_length_14228_cov_3.787105_11_plen_215_part_00